MRVLLDECLPRRLKLEIIGHDVATVPEVGWAGVKNGDLLRRAAERFDAFVTVDQGIAFPQETLASLRVIVLAAPSNRLGCGRSSRRYSMHLTRRAPAGSFGLPSRGRGETN